MASKRFPANTHNLARHLILALDALEHHLCLESFGLMPLPSLLMEHLNKPREQVSSRYRSIQQHRFVPALIICFSFLLMIELTTPINFVAKSFHTQVCQNGTNVIPPRVEQFSGQTMRTLLFPQLTTI